MCRNRDLALEKQTAYTRPHWLQAGTWVFHQYRRHRNYQTSKMKRHRKFAAEMLPYERRVDTVIAVGDDLIYQRHPASDDISARLTKLECAWHDLIDAIRTMSNRVDEAYEAGIGDRSVILMVDAWF